MIDLSIVIVNYNVKAYLTSLLYSIQKAEKHLKLQIFVIDNASVDGSISYLTPLFPDVNFISNKRNVGFGKAHNQVLGLLTGKYSLFINPDSLIQEDTLVTMVEFMDSNNDVGLATCKLLNADGSFSKDCIRNLPTPWSALIKVLGLAEKFPKSNLFGSYYLRDQEPIDVIDVPVISGSFMFIRTELFKILKGFDPRYFMYFEDTDLCIHISKLGYKIKYVPKTSVIHYRGESTKKQTLNHHLIFNKALYQFYKKNYSSAYGLIFRILILLGIAFRAVLIYSKTVIKSSFNPLIDLIVINIILFISFVLRYDLKWSTIIDTYAPEHFAINVMATLFFIIIGVNYSIYSKNKHSIVALFKTLFYSFAGVALVTFFLRDFAFSRLIILGSVVIGFCFLSLTRLIRRKKYAKSISKHSIEPSRVLIIGVDKKTKELIQKLRAEISWNYEIVGVIPIGSIKKEYLKDVELLGELNSLLEIVKINRIDEVFFQINAVDNQTILTWISKLPKHITTRLIPDTLDFILGKTNVNYFNGVPIVDLDIPYQKTWNKFIKRALDLSVSSISLLLVLPLTLFVMLTKNKREIELYIDDLNSTSIQLWKGKSIVLKILSLMIYVLKGRISLVGAEIKPNHSRNFPLYKYGITGLRQLNEHRVQLESEKEQYELHYIQEYAIWMDLELILKTLILKLEPVKKVLDKFN